MYEPNFQGFRMVVGSPTYSPADGSRGNAGLKFVCLENKGTRFPELPNFPTGPCRGGIMTVHHFPSCWDGKNLDSPDHKSHVAYSNSGGLGTPNCPSTHPVAIPQVMYEIMWDTARYKNNAWYGAGKQPFVYSFGDG